MPDESISAPNPPDYYTDTYDTLNVDINNDSIFDFRFTSNRYFCWISPSSGYGPGYTTRITALNTNSKIALGGTTFCYDYALASDSGAIIDNQIQSWITSATLNYRDFSGWGWMTCSQPSSVKYYPIKFYNDSNYYFGWFRIKSADGWIVLYDAAINMSPGEPIYAGQTITEIKNSKNEQNINVSFKDNILYIENTNRQNPNCTILIVNNLGQSIFSKNLAKNTDQINLGNYQSGIYYVRIVTPFESYTKKIIL